MMDPRARHSAFDPAAWSWTPAVAFGLLCLWLLTYPFDFAPQVVSPWLADRWLGKINSLSNVLMFLPLGVAAGWKLALSRRSMLAAIIGAVVLAVVISLIGETLQVWLPDRHSSWIDILANAAGAALGAMWGSAAEASLTARWASWRFTLSQQPKVRSAAWWTSILLIARLAPFDFSVETYHLRMGWRETVGAGGLLAWHGSTLLTAALFAVFTWSLCRMMRQGFERRGDFGSAALLVGIGAILCLIVTELLQWPIRSRVMDLADLAAGCCGIVVAGFADVVVGPLRGSSPSSMAGPPVRQPSTMAREVHCTPTPHVPHVHLAGRSLIFLAVAATFVVAYGSIVPLQFDALSFEQTASRFMHIMRHPGESKFTRGDVVTNVILFGAMAAAWMAACCPRRRPLLATLFFSTVITAFSVGLGVALEFIQMFIPDRTTSPFDVLAQLVGSLGGVALWVALGHNILHPVEKLIRGEGEDAWRAMLKLYFIGYLLYALMPLDFVMNVSEWKLKYNHQISLIPFTYPWPSAAAATWDALRDVVLAVPLGLLFFDRRFEPAGVHRSLRRALMFLVIVEAIQMLLVSRVSDSTDVITGMIGVSLGTCWLASRKRQGIAWTARRYVLLGTVYALALACVNLLPFGLDLSRIRWDVIQNELFAPPLSRLYLEQSFLAFDQILAKILLVVPLGYLLGRAVAAPARRRPRIGATTFVFTIMAGWLCGIELLQVASPTRVADSTDIMLGMLGAAIGIAVAAITRPAPTAVHPASAAMFAARASAESSG